MRLSFFGHYNEPDLQLPATDGVYRITLDVMTRGAQWRVRKLDESVFSHVAPKTRKSQPVALPLVLPVVTPSPAARVVRE